MSFQLRPYQSEMLDAISAVLVDEGQNRLLCQAATGLGKTVCFSNIPRWPALQPWLSSYPKRGASMLVIAHREEILDQAAEKIRGQNPGLMVAVEQGDRVASRYSDVIVASIQTLASRQYTRLKRLLQYHQFRIVIVDEAHHAAAATYRTTLALLGFLPLADTSTEENIEAATHDDIKKMEAALKGWDAEAPQDRVLIGVTATPNRSDDIGLGCVFQKLVYSYGLKKAIADQWLVPIKPWLIETSESLDGVRITAGEFNQKDLAKAVNHERRNRLALDAWQHHAGDRATLGFTVDVAHAHAMAELFKKGGVAAEAISGETDKEVRRHILRDYTAGRVQVIFNCMVLTEGTDLPLTSCVLHLKPTKSATLYEQMTGRGLRLHPGKVDCVVLDLVDIARKHTLQAAPVLYGLPPGIKTVGDDLKKLEGDIEALHEAMPQFDIEAALANARYSIEELTARSKTFDIWKIPSLGEMAAGRTLNWIKISGFKYRVSYPWADGIEVLEVTQDLVGKWEVVATLTPREVGGPRRQRTVAAGIPTPNEALGLAEVYVSGERGAVAKLKAPDAPWRLGPPSDKQLSTLRRMRVPFAEAGLTKGKASDLIDIAMTRVSRGRRY